MHGSISPAKAIHRRLEVRSRFKRAFIDGLKEDVPWEERTWKPAKKVWSVSISFADEVVWLLGRYFRRVQCSEEALDYLYDHSRAFQKVLSRYD